MFGSPYASSLRVQRLRPSGGLLQLKAIRWAFEVPSKVGSREDFYCFLRPSVASNPCSTNLLRIQPTVQRCNEKAWAVAYSGQVGPSVSVFSMILARLIIKTTVFPLVIISLNWLRSPSFSRTIFFSLTSSSSIWYVWEDDRGFNLWNQTWLTSR